MLAGQGEEEEDGKKEGFSAAFTPHQGRVQVPGQGAGHLGGGGCTINRSTVWAQATGSSQHCMAPSWHMAQGDAKAS